MPKSQNEDDSPVALVVGFNIHGLAVARSLASSGVTVYAMNAYHHSPSNSTRFATVFHEPGIREGSVAGALVNFSKNILKGRTAVLFPTSDRIAADIARNWDELATYCYQLSWSDNRDIVLKLQNKNTLPAICEQAGILHPRSIKIESEDDIAQAIHSIRFPAIVKPERPQSSFKAIRVENVASLRNLVSQYSIDLPFIVQQYISGPSRNLVFCTMLLKNGAIIAVSSGRKLAAKPSDTGQGTIMATEILPEADAISRRFLANLGYSGPISIEFKIDDDGNYWLIEPNVGRTEYCVDATIKSGLNLPFLEYRATTSNFQTSVPMRTTQNVVWYDTDKDPLCYIKHRIQSLRTQQPVGPAVFPYIGHSDYAPVLRSVVRRISDVATKFKFRFTNRSSGPTTAPTE